MKHAKLMTLALFGLAFTGIQAEGSYLGFGLGLQFDLASLGKTITTDGLDASGVGAPPYLSTNNGVGGSQCLINNNCPPNPYSGSRQQVIVDEKTLIAYSKFTYGAISAHTSGPMTGAVLKAFYEKDLSPSSSIRVGLNYTRKIMGGETSSEAMGVSWYQITWNYWSVVTPAYFILKAGVGETGTVYGGGGINYAKGGWSLSGTNLGWIPTTFVTRWITGGSLGLVPTQSPASTGFGTASLASSPQGVWGAKQSFKAEGLGFNFIIGVEKKLASGDKLFFEIENIVAGGFGHQAAQSPGAVTAIAPVAAYPVNLSGTIYTFGYKMAM